MNATLKKKKCKECGTQFVQYSSLQSWCSADCGVKVALKAKAKKEEAERKAERKKDKEWVEANRSYGYLLDRAQKAVNTYVRWRDYHKPCISCGTHKPDNKFGGAWDAGHYRSVGSSQYTRFVLINIWKQCKKCNDSRGLSGNPVEYRKNLVIKLGEERVLRIEHDNRPRNYSKDDLRRIAKIFNKRARWYKKRRLAEMTMEA